MQRTWANGDQVTLHLPRQADASHLDRQQQRRVRQLRPSDLLPADRRSVADATAAILPGRSGRAIPTTPWNYGLSLDSGNPAASFRVITNGGPVPANPFSLETVPISLQVKARRIPEWRLDSLNVVSPLQPSPAYSTQAEETVTLVPMGAARLRISAFPTVSTNSALAAVSGARRTRRAPPIAGAATPCRRCAMGCCRRSSSDTTIPRFTWWDHLGTAEWVRADFSTTNRVSQVSVYWYDDTGFGQCRVPQSWVVEYLAGTNWVQVSGAGSYGVARD